MESRMTCASKPSFDDLLELRGGHARMGRHDQFDEATFPGFREGFHVAVERSLKWLLISPVRIHRRQRLDAVERKGELDIHGLFAPQRAIVVESCDALRQGNKIRRALLGHLGHKIHQRLLCRTLVPGWKRLAFR